MHYTMIILLLQAIISSSAARVCNFSYAVEHSYSAVNLTALGISTRDVWYINGEILGAGSTIHDFVKQTDDEVQHKLISYVTKGQGRGIDGGFNTTNAIVLDIETPVQLLPLLGDWLRTNTSLFDQVVQAYARRLRVTTTVFPRARVGLYGSPISPGKHAGHGCGFQGAMRISIICRQQSTS